jgi:hypothetical protein
MSWAFSSGATPGWTLWLPPSVPVGRHAGAMFDRRHEISAIAVTVPILGTLALLAWGALKGHRMPHHRRILVPRAREAYGLAAGRWTLNGLRRRSWRATRPWRPTAHHRDRGGAPPS